MKRKKIKQHNNRTLITMKVIKTRKKTTSKTFFNFKNNLTTIMDKVF